MDSRAGTVSLPDWYDDLFFAMLGETPSRAAKDPALAEGIAALSLLFREAPGRERPDLEGYLSSRAASSAYFAYYVTANCLKLTRPLDELRRSDSFASLASLRVLDLGCGPGTGAIGLAAWLDRLERSGGTKPEIRYTAADRMNAALAWTSSAHAFLAARGAFGRGAFAKRRVDLNRLEPSGEAFDLILLMNLVNELADPRRLLNSLATQLADDGSVILVEPALRLVTRELLTLRDHAIDDGWTVYAPCFTQAGCPALEHEHDWCHDELPWDRPKWYALLDEALGNVKHSLKYSYLVLNRHGETLADAVGVAKPQRVVSEAFREKGRTRAFLCGADGRSACMLNTRDATPSNEDFASVRRYDIVEISGEIRRKHDVQIAPGTLVRLAR